MDVNVLFFGTIIVFVMGLLAIGIGRERGVMVGFFGGILGILFMSSLNTDNAIQGLAAGAPTGIFPYFYFLLLPTIFDFAMALYEGVGKR